MQNQLNNFRKILAEYMHLSGIKISVFLKDGSKVNLSNAIMKKDYIINNYYEDFSGKNILLKDVEFAELYTD